ncbi:MAG: pirin family protein [Calditrichaeota bacterium]|nr:MAG: pirin family protein [Calditrichota bacterium]
MKKTIHRADSRGHFDHGWLKTYHTFSFGQYYDPTHIHFGKLRVLNDDVIGPGQGFGRHPHDNMEIVTIPLHGALAHADSEGHEQVIRPNEIQIMSAGTGIWHSEYNHSDSESAGLLQIWIFPDAKGHKPRYDQKTIDPLARQDKFHTFVSPAQEEDTLWLHQDAYFSLADLQQGAQTTSRLNSPGNGVYLFLIEGKIEVAGEDLNRKDGIGLWEIDEFTVQSQSESQLLAIEVPMR